MDCGKYEYYKWDEKNFLKLLCIQESGISNNRLRDKILHSSRAKKQGGSFEIS